MQSKSKKNNDEDFTVGFHVIAQKIIMNNQIEKRNSLMMLKLNGRKLRKQKTSRIYIRNLLNGG